MRATLRWAHSDLRTHRGEALFLGLATAGIVLSLLLATALFGYATNPWQRVFEQTRGAHVWLHTARSAKVGKLAGLDGVESVAGPYATEATTVTSHGTRAAVELRATPSTSAPAARSWSPAAGSTRRTPTAWSWRAISPTPCSRSPATR